MIFYDVAFFAILNSNKIKRSLKSDFLASLNPNIGNHRLIFCQKNLIFPRSLKKLWKNILIFFSFRNCPKLHFFEKKLSRLAFLGEKFANIANLEVKIALFRVKCIKICSFWSYSFPPLISPYYNLAEYCWQPQLTLFLDAIASLDFWYESEWVSKLELVCSK